jgi:hypothetical protein
MRQVHLRSRNLDVANKCRGFALARLSERIRPNRRIHNHMLDDQPHLSSMHFWANDALKSVLREGSLQDKPGPSVATEFDASCRESMTNAEPASVLPVSFHSSGT